MHSFSFTLLAVAALLVSLAQGMYTPSVDERAINTAGKLEWNGMSLGKNVTLYGTASEIMEQLKAADPNWVPANRGKSLDKISKRSMVTPPLCCPVRGQPWTPVSIENLQIAIDHLDMIGGSYNMPAHSCTDAMSNGLSSCVEGAGVALCNPNPHPFEMSTGQMAEYAVTLIKDCPSSGGKMCGQIFDTARWNVVLSPC